MLMRMAGGSPANHPFVGAVRLSGMRSTFLFALAAVALAQSPQTLPRFDVASVKPSGQGPHPLGRGLYVYAGGRIVASMCSLDYLVQQAFELQPFQISGPRWIGEEYYDIEA